MPRTDGVSSASSGDPELDPATDCSECRSAGSVRWGICEICYAEYDEFPLQPMDSSAKHDPLL